MKVKIILFLILIISAFLRIYNLDTRGLFTDEKYTLLNANGIWVGGANQKEVFLKQHFTPNDFWQPKKIKDYFDAIAHSDFGTHITYNAILHPYMKVFGNDDFTVRLLSVIFNLISILLVFYIVKDILKNNLAALLSAFFVAIEPLNVVQSHIARSYTLSFLLVILITYLFLKIIDSKTKSNKRNGYLIIYTILVGLTLLNHYLNFLVPLSHAIVFVFLKKDFKLWLKFITAGMFNIILMFWWFNYGGGYTSFEFLKDKNEKQLKIAQLQGKTGMSFVELSKPDVVIKKSLTLFYDLGVVSEGTYEALNGVKNFLVSILLFGIVLLLYYNIKAKNNKYVILSFLLIVGICWQFYPIISGLLTSNFLYLLLYFGCLKFIENFKLKQNLVSNVLFAICLLMLVLPILFVINDAIKNGHTTSLTQRYIGIATPFVAILTAIGYISLRGKWKTVSWLIVLILGIQYFKLKQDFLNYFEDQSNKYAYYSPPRVKNPYLNIAKSVIKIYKTGDTLLIPSKDRNIYAQMFGKPNSISYSDAQYINLYLPSNSNIIERIDAKEADKFILVDKEGKKHVIFDMQGSKYRY